jgi:hypothetical protein
MTDAPVDVQPDATPDQADAAPVEATPGAPGAWPEAPYAPASPQFPTEPGDRIRVRAHVAIFDLDAGAEGEVFDTPEVHACAAAGLLDIL